MNVSKNGSISLGYVFSRLAKTWDIDLTENVAKQS